MHDYDAKDDDDSSSKKGKGKGLKEFECPSCNANNPTDDPIANGAEVKCNYCGNDFLVSITDSGKMRLKEI